MVDDTDESSNDLVIVDKALPWESMIWLHNSLFQLKMEWFS